MVPWSEVLNRAKAVVSHVVQNFHRGAMVLVLQQDLELVVLVAVYVFCLDLFGSRRTKRLRLTYTTLCL